MRKEMLKENAILVLLLLGIMALFAIPDNESPTWIADLLVSKLIAMTCFYAIGKLSPLGKTESKTTKTGSKSETIVCDNL